MSPYNILLYLPEYRNNRVCYQWLDKVGLAPTGTSPVEKFKCIKWDFLDLALLNRSNLLGGGATRLCAHRRWQPVTWGPHPLAHPIGQMDLG